MKRQPLSDTEPDDHSGNNNAGAPILCTLLPRLCVAGYAFALKDDCHGFQKDREMTIRDKCAGEGGEVAK